MKTLRIVLALALALVLSAALVGCNRGLPQDEIDRIIENVTNAQFDTVKMDMDMTIDMEIVGGTQPGTVVVTGSGNAIMDIANQEIQMTMNMTMDIMGMDVQEVPTSSYLVGEWLYTSVSAPGLGTHWFKKAVTPGMWEQQSQVEQQMEFLRSAADVRVLADQAVYGTDCYVFEIVPSVEALGELLSQQGTATVGMDFSRLDLAELFEEMRVKQWIAKDSYQVLKTEVYMRMRMDPDDVEASAVDFDEMIIDIDMTMWLYDYDQPVSIVVPEEALAAQEL